MYKCAKCKENLDLELMDKRLIYCKNCKKLISKLYYENNKEKVKQSVKTYRDNNLDKVKNMVNNYQKENNEEIKEYKHNYYKTNIDDLKPKYKENYLKKKDNLEFKKQRSEYIKKQRLNPMFKLKDRISGLIRNTLKNKGIKKKQRTEIILGCTVEDFKSYIENKFIEGMCWENMGKWHIDHITPISYAKTEDDLLKLNHYTNLQPLWQKDNLSKGNRYIG